MRNRRKSLNPYPCPCIGECNCTQTWHSSRKTDVDRHLYSFHDKTFGSKQMYNPKKRIRSGKEGKEGGNTRKKRKTTSKEEAFYSTDQLFVKRKRFLNEKKKKKTIKAELRLTKRLLIDAREDLKHNKEEKERLEIELFVEKGKTKALFQELIKICNKLEEKEDDLEEKDRLVLEKEELLKETRELVNEKQLLEDQLAVWKLRNHELKQNTTLDFMLLESQKQKLKNLEKLKENLTNLIIILPKNSPIRRELLQELYKNEIEKKWFVEQVIMSSGLGKRYIESLKNSNEKKHIFLKYSLDTKRKVWSDDAQAAFKDILDSIMPYRSGRDWRIRKKNFQDTYGDYVLQMSTNYSTLFGQDQYYSYTVFWDKVRKTGDRIRKYVRTGWCQWCVWIDKGDRLMEAIAENDMSSIDFEYNDDWIQKYRELKAFHVQAVHTQYKYYQEQKRLLLTNRNTHSFVVVQDFSKLDIEKGDSFQDQIFTVYYFDPNSPDKLSYKYIHYIDNTKNDKYFVFKSWEHLLESHSLFSRIKNANEHFKIIIFSDGARKHYKQRFSVTYFAFLQSKYSQVDFMWNFFISNHGFNSCDSAASHAKRRLNWFIQSFDNEHLGSAERAAKCITHDTSIDSPDYKWKGCKNHQAFALTGLIYRPTTDPSNIPTIGEIASNHQYVYSTGFENNLITHVTLKVYKLSKEENGDDNITGTYIYYTPGGTNDGNDEINTQALESMNDIWEGNKEILSILEEAEQQEEQEEAEQQEEAPQTQEMEVDEEDNNDSDSDFVPE